MNRKKGESSSIIPTEAVGLILGSIVLVGVLSFLVILWGVFISDGIDTLEEFNRFSTSVSSMIQSPTRYDTMQQMFYMDDDYVMVGFDANQWEGFDKKIDECLYQHFEKPAILCGRKACICLYSRGDFSKPIACNTLPGNTYIYANWFSDDLGSQNQKIIDSRGVADFNRGIEKISHYGTDTEKYEFLVLYGVLNCVDGKNFKNQDAQGKDFFSKYVSGQKFHTQLLYVEKYVNSYDEVNIMIALSNEVPTSRGELLAKKVKEQKEEELQRVIDAIANQAKTIIPKFGFERSQVEALIRESSPDTVLNWQTPGGIKSLVNYTFTKNGNIVSISQTKA